MAAEEQPQELFTENIQLQEENARLKRLKGRVERHPDMANESRDEGQSSLNDRDARIIIDRTFTGNKICKGITKALLKLLVIVLIVAGVITAYVFIERRYESHLEDLISAVTPSKTEPPRLFSGNLPMALKSKAGNKIDRYYLNIGMRPDYQLQECQTSALKQSFPDVDYSLLGYNVLKGFPLAIGHDPGFTYPIFRHDYSSGGMTADCRYSVPRGLVIIPDVSCVTSFSSTEIQTKYEFSKELSVSANVHGGGWGVKFSASAGYKQSSSEMSTGESVYILSSAHCNYYFSKLIKENAPPFDDVFIQWVDKLNQVYWDNPELYFNFFETYGTHFPTEVKYGARFTYEHKMSSSQYEKEKKSGVNVAVEASYSGLISVGGGFSLDTEQREKASAFSKSVETRTITVGAPPPANGSATEWASEVKSSPVPTKYELSSIEELFTARYMRNLNVDFKRIRKNIEGMKKGYCEYLRKKGTVESCESLVAGIELANTRLHGPYKEMQVALIGSECIEKCLEEIQCVAVTACTSCKNGHYAFNTCYLFEETGHSTSAEKNTMWQSNIFPEKMNYQIQFNNTAIVGVPRGFENDQGKSASLTQCHELCIKDAHCVAYTHCDCPNKISKCKLYSKKSTLLSGLEEEPDTKAFFISRRQNIATTTPVPTTSENTTANTTHNIN